MTELPANLVHSLDQAYASTKEATGKLRTWTEHNVPAEARRIAQFHLVMRMLVQSCRGKQPADLVDRFTQVTALLLLDLVRPVEQPREMPQVFDARSGATHLTDPTTNHDKGFCSALTTITRPRLRAADRLCATCAQGAAKYLLGHQETSQPST